MNSFDIDYQSYEGDIFKKVHETQKKLTTTSRILFGVVFLLFFILTFVLW